MGLFRARWTSEIHDEWTRNLLLNRPDLDAQKLQRTRDLMDASVMGCLVTGYQSLVNAINLPDKDDRHVLAAAIHCSADAIITFNLKDFPPSAMKDYEIEAQHPDEFLHHQFGLDSAAVLRAARNCRDRLRNPQKNSHDYLNTLESQSLPKLISELRPFADLI